MPLVVAQQSLGLTISSLSSCQQHLRMLVLVFLSLVAFALALSATRPQDDFAVVPALHEESVAHCRVKCMMYPAPYKRECMMACPVGLSSEVATGFDMPTARRAFMNIDDCYSTCIQQDSKRYSDEGCQRKCTLMFRPNPEYIAYKMVAGREAFNLLDDCGKQCFNRLSSLMFTNPSVLTKCYNTCAEKYDN